MRNLKRVLSLGLALVMMLSLMIVSAGAASTYDSFTDKDEIVNTEAVNTMVSLGVIDGKDDGSFDPTGIVTRAEMAKLIAVTMNGGTDPLLGSNTTATQFTDTKGHWAEAYIAWCVNLGVINGRGDGTFGPDETVTGTAAAKMMLTALGYRADIEGLTGAGWNTNTEVLANRVELFDGITADPDNGMTRDDVAQLIYNGVQADEVVYRNNYGEYSGVIYAQPVNGTGNNSTVLWTRFHVQKVEGVVLATDLISLDGNPAVAGKARLTNVSVDGGDIIENNNVPAIQTYPVDIDDELLGQKVVLYVEGLKDLAPNAASTKVVSEPIVSLDNTVVDTTGRLKDDDAVKDALRGSGLAVPAGGADNGITISWDDTVVNVNNTAGGGADNRINGVTGAASYPGMAQRFIDNNADGTVDVIIRTTDTLTKVNTYNESKEQLNLAGIGTIDFEDIVNPEDVAKDDYVLVYNYDDTYVLKAVETVTGVVTDFVDNARDGHLSKITVDGTDYGWSEGENLAPAVLDKDDTAGGNLNDLVNGSYTLYLDSHGNMLGYVEDEGAIGNYGVITGVNSTGHANGFLSAEVKMILADGTTGKYDVNLLASANKYGLVQGGTNAAKEAAMYDMLTGDTAPRTGDVDQANSMVGALVSYSISNNTITFIDPDVSTSSYYGASYVNAADSELKVMSSTAGYDNFTKDVVGSDGIRTVSLTADDRTVFFFRDSEGTYSVVTGLSNVRASGLDAQTGSTAQAIYYQPAGNRAAAVRAMFVPVQGVFTSSSNYAFVSGDYRETVSGNDTVYTYPVVFESGEPGTLSTKTTITGTAKNYVHEYQNDGSYVNFGTDRNVVNNRLVTQVGSNSITTVDATAGAGTLSYSTSGATVWDVQDINNIFKSEIQINDKVALILKDGKVKTAFIYDHVDGDLAPVANGAITVSDDDGNVAFVNNAATLFNVTAGQDLDIDVIAAAGQTITVSATVDGVKQDLANNGKVDNSAGTANKPGNFKIHTYTATEDATEVVISVAVAQDGYATRTLTYTLTLYAAAGTTYLGDADTAAINAAGNNVVVTGDLTVDTALNLGAGKTVTVMGDVALNANLTGAGKLTVEGTTVVENGMTINANMDTAALDFVGNVTISGGRTVNVTGENALVILDGTTDVDGTLNIADGRLALNSKTLKSTSGTGLVTVNGEVILGSTIEDVTVKATTAVLANNFTMSGTGKLELTGDVVDQTAGVATITLEDTADLTVQGDVAANVTAEDTATVSAGTATGTITNNGTGDVTVGEEPVLKVEELAKDEVKTAGLYDNRSEEEGQIASKDLVGTYTVTGTKTSTGEDGSKVTTYTLTLTANALKQHENAESKMGYWAGINIAAATTDSYISGWGTCPAVEDSSSWNWIEMTNDTEVQSTGHFSMYWNFGSPNATSVIYMAVKDADGNINIYNITNNVTCGQ